MNTTHEEYKSEFGWSMNLPGNWRRLSRMHPEARAPLAVFSTPEDWSLSFNWMLSRQPAGETAVTAFDTATMLPGRLDLDEATRVVDALFPLIGELARASAIVLPDGQKAIEVVETITPKGSIAVEKITYALILPRRKRGEYKEPAHFQRLSFTAPPALFHDRIQEIVKAARSFHYSKRTH